MRVKASDWLKRASFLSTISLATSDGTPYVGDLAKLWSVSNMEAYRTTRDFYRDKRGQLELLEGSNVSDYAG